MLFTLVALAGAASAAAQQRTDYGTLSIQMRPPNAEVFIDGERWVGSGAAGALQVQLPAGVHRVEIRSAGLQTFVQEVTIRAGETVPLNVSLTATTTPAGPPPPARPPVEPAPRVGPATPHRPIQVTPAEDGYVFAPDVRITEVNHYTTTLLGAYGGYVFDGKVLVGLGAYWQVYGTYGSSMGYFGPVFEYRLFTDKTIGLNLHGLIGGGWQYGQTPYYYAPVGHHGGSYGYYYYYNNQAFFVVEPEAQVVVRFSPTIRLQGGIGYRATSAHGLDGVSGSISLQLGR
jgi:hypothetical protein